jgi:hypothetical protein
MRYHRSIRVIILCLSASCLQRTANAAVPDSTGVSKWHTDSSNVYQLELRDGSSFFGRIVSEDVEYVHFVTLTGNKLDLRKTDIRTREQVEQSQFVKGTYWFRNPNPTRYLFGPSAFNLKKGEGYYQNTYILLNSFNVGVTDHITVGGGFELISTFFSGSEGPIFLLTPKIGFEVSPKFHVGGGLLYVSVPAVSASRTGLGVGYGIATYGTENSNITGGLGWGFVEGEFASQPVLTISGMHRISRKVALVSENWLIPTDTYYGIYSYGIRFFGEKIAVDIAFLNNPDIAQGLAIGIPYLDFVVKF